MNDFNYNKNTMNIKFNHKSNNYQNYYVYRHMLIMIEQHFAWD
jgi:hypothetical protein